MVMIRKEGLVWCWLRHLVLLGLLVHVGAHGDVVKKVVSTPWWPPGTEKTAESVGIISHGFAFMTAMMEVNDTLHKSAVQEMLDVRDIAVAAGTNLSNLVDCFVNAPAGRGVLVRQALLSAMPADLQQNPPAFTVVEMPGEYQFVPHSIMCVATLPGATELRQTWKHDGLYAVSARGMLFVEGAMASPECAKEPFLETQDVLARIHQLGQMTGDSFDLVDCTAYLAEIKEAAAVRRAFADMHAARRVQPAITLVQADGLPAGNTVLLRCTGTLSKASWYTRTKPQAIQGATITDRFVFTSAQLGRNSSGADAFGALQQVLESAEVSLKEVVTCSFYVRDQAKMFDLFAGFYQTFNKDNPPPPTRGEYQAETECADCAVAVKCVAARLAPAVAPHSIASDGSLNLVI